MSSTLEASVVSDVLKPAVLATIGHLPQNLADHSALVRSEK
ncbi:MAG: hypothetical protein QXK88_10315 [Desulfurococcaceae archaeon]